MQLGKKHFDKLSKITFPFHKKRKITNSNIYYSVDVYLNDTNDFHYDNWNHLLKLNLITTTILEEDYHERLSLFNRRGKH